MPRVAELVSPENLSSSCSGSVSGRPRRSGLIPASTAPSSSTLSSSSQRLAKPPQPPNEISHTISLHKGSPTSPFSAFVPSSKPSQSSIRDANRLSQEANETPAARISSDPTGNGPNLTHRGTKIDKAVATNKERIDPPVEKEYVVDGNSDDNKAVKDNTASPKEGSYIQQTLDPSRSLNKENKRNICRSEDALMQQSSFSSDLHSTGIHSSHWHPPGKKQDSSSFSEGGRERNSQRSVKASHQLYAATSSPRPVPSEVELTQTNSMPTSVPNSSFSTNIVGASPLSDACKKAQGNHVSHLVKKPRSGDARSTSPGHSAGSNDDDFRKDGAVIRTTRRHTLRSGSHNLIHVPRSDNCNQADEGHVDDPPISSLHCSELIQMQCSDLFESGNPPSYNPGHSHSDRASGEIDEPIDHCDSLKTPSSFLQGPCSDHGRDINSRKNAEVFRQNENHRTNTKILPTALRRSTRIAGDQDITSVNMSRRSGKNSSCDNRTPDYQQLDQDKIRFCGSRVDGKKNVGSGDCKIVTSECSHGCDNGDNDAKSSVDVGHGNLSFNNHFNAGDMNRSSGDGLRNKLDPQNQDLEETLSESIAKYELALELLSNATTDYQVGRENEVRAITDYIKECVDSQRGGAIYISGLSGTGKSLTVKHVLRQFCEKVRMNRGSDEYRNKLIDEFVELKCVNYDRDIQIFGELGQRLIELLYENHQSNKKNKNGSRNTTAKNDKSTHGQNNSNHVNQGNNLRADNLFSISNSDIVTKSTSQFKQDLRNEYNRTKKISSVIHRFTEKFKRKKNDSHHINGSSSLFCNNNNGMILCLIDEVDHLPTQGRKRGDLKTANNRGKQSDILMALFQLATHPDSRLIIVAVSNSVELAIDIRNNSLLKVVFEPYGVDQLQRIIDERLRILTEKKITIFAAHSIALHVRKSVNYQGDCRMLLSAFCNAINQRLAELRSHQATLEVIAPLVEEGKEKIRCDELLSFHHSACGGKTDRSVNDMSFFSINGDSEYSSSSRRNIAKRKASCNAAELETLASNSISSSVYCSDVDEACRFDRCNECSSVPSPSLSPLSEKSKGDSDLLETKVSVYVDGHSNSTATIANSDLTRRRKLSDEESTASSAFYSRQGTVTTASSPHPLSTSCSLVLSPFNDCCNDDDDQLQILETNSGLCNAETSYLGDRIVTGDDEYDSYGVAYCGRLSVDSCDTNNEGTTVESSTQKFSSQRMPGFDCIDRDAPVGVDCSGEGSCLKSVDGRRCRPPQLLLSKNKIEQPFYRCSHLDKDRDKDTPNSVGGSSNDGKLPTCRSSLSASTCVGMDSPPALPDTPSMISVCQSSPRDDGSSTPTPTSSIDKTFGVYGLVNISTHVNHASFPSRGFPPFHSPTNPAALQISRSLSHHLHSSSSFPLQCNQDGRRGSLSVSSPASPSTSSSVLKAQTPTEGQAFMTATTTATALATEHSSPTSSFTSAENSKWMSPSSPMVTDSPLRASAALTRAQAAIMTRKGDSRPSFEGLNGDSRPMDDCDESHQQQYHSLQCHTTRLSRITSPRAFHIGDEDEGTNRDDVCRLPMDEIKQALQKAPINSKGISQIHTRLRHRHSHSGTTIRMDVDDFSENTENSINMIYGNDGSPSNARNLQLLVGSGRRRSLRGGDNRSEAGSQRPALNDLTNTFHMGGPKTSPSSEYSTATPVTRPRRSSLHRNTTLSQANQDKSIATNSQPEVIGIRLINSRTNILYGNDHAQMKDKIESLPLIQKLYLLAACKAAESKKTQSGSNQGSNLRQHDAYRPVEISYLEIERQYDKLCSGMKSGHLASCHIGKSCWQTAIETFVQENFLKSKSTKTSKTQAIPMKKRHSSFASSPIGFRGVANARNLPGQVWELQMPPAMVASIIAELEPILKDVDFDEHFNRGIEA